MAEKDASERSWLLPRAASMSPIKRCMFFSVVLQQLAPGIIVLSGMGLYKISSVKASTIHGKPTNYNLDTGHANGLPHQWYCSGQEVNRVQGSGRHNQTSELLKPSVEVRGRHEQHPPVHCGHCQRKLDSPSRRLGTSMLPLEPCLSPSVSVLALRTRPSFIIRRASRRPVHLTTTGSSSIQSMPLPSTSRKTCPLMS